MLKEQRSKHSPVSCSNHSGQGNIKATIFCSTKQGSFKVWLNSQQSIAVSTGSGGREAQ